LALKSGVGIAYPSVLYILISSKGSSDQIYEPSERDCRIEALSNAEEHGIGLVEVALVGQG
jgi:hypothetical protein